MRLVHLFYCFLVSVLLASCVPVCSAVIDTGRKIDWSVAGTTGGIVTRTVICNTLNPGATAAQINSAIASCASGQVVKLNAGTYNLSSNILFANKSNITLRGAGPDQTKLVFSAGGACILDADVCVINNGGIPNADNPGTVANWTAGYSKDTTSITLSTTTGLTV